MIGFFRKLLGSPGYQNSINFCDHMIQLLDYYKMTTTLPHDSKEYNSLVKTIGRLHRMKKKGPNDQDTLNRVTEAIRYNLFKWTK